VIIARNDDLPRHSERLPHRGNAARHRLHDQTLLHRPEAIDDEQTGPVLHFLSAAVYAALFGYAEFIQLSCHDR